VFFFPAKRQMKKRGHNARVFSAEIYLIQYHQLSIFSLCQAAGFAHFLTGLSVSSVITRI
jgi:hypothetical protein